MLLATTDPAMSLGTGAAAGVTGLLINILSDQFLTPGFHLKKKALQKLLDERFSPIRAGLLWVFINSDHLMSVKEICSILPYNESAIRKQLRRMEIAGIVERITENSATDKWSLKK